ncbi:hypothetical protein KFU94_45795 [Chloroflexi bacterium TSY]|nr:hypothetical protein [Chloroflexi bacterium TSY]
MKLWPFNNNRSTKKQRIEQLTRQLLTQAAQQIEAGVPRQAICDSMLDPNRAFSSPEEMYAFTDVGQRIYVAMVDRNQKANCLESQGNLAEAIRLYEESVADRFDGSLPYSRLRKLYAGSHDFQNAIRICQSYINMATSNKSRRESKAKRIEKYAKLIHKMELKLEQIKRVQTEQPQAEQTQTEQLQKEQTQTTHADIGHTHRHPFNEEQTEEISVDTETLPTSDSPSTLLVPAQFI